MSPNVRTANIPALPCLRAFSTPPTMKMSDEEIGRTDAVNTE